MLKYKVRLTEDNMDMETMVWSEKYLAPNLSFVSGVTSQNYHLEKYSKLAVTNKLMSNPNAIVNVESENVTRQGYVVIKGKQYEPFSGSVIDYSVESGGTVVDYNYLFLNGKYYYADSANTYHIDNWLTETFEEDEDRNIRPKIVEKDIEVSEDAKIDTIAWIEDGIVTIDGYGYYYDRDTKYSSSASIGGLKFYEDGDILDASAITECDSIECHPFNSPSDYLEVTKFTLTKNDEVDEPFERISFCKYFYYVEYKDYYLPIRQEFSGDSYSFKCDVPNYLLCDDSETSGETTSFDVYYASDYSSIVLESGETLDSSNVSGHGVHNFDDLKDILAYVVIDEAAFLVSHDIQNANEGRFIAIYLDGSAETIGQGDRIKIIDTSDVEHRQLVHSVSEYGFNSGDTSFILFDDKKYKLEANLCDKVIINDNEYSIDYINGKEDNVDCLVLIGDEEVPMKISGETLQRYGRIILSGINSADTATYDIKPYSGITVDNKRYIVYSEESGDTYAVLDFPNQYTFIVDEVIGSSMLVCRPDINATDFTDEFNIFISKEICGDVVENQDNMIVYGRNKIFGDKEITEELAFQMYSGATSSDDYYNLFDNFDIFVRNRYINLPLNLSAPQGGNVLQDDLVVNRFFEEEKKKAINPIVDMEKDVYIPKYIANNDGQYSGSNTEFRPIEEIRVNLHFRTRDLDSWKVNEGYNNIATSGISDNWFVTDFHPYIDILSASADTLLNTSDLVGLMNFTNNDVYYQKSKIANSFLRFSYYDSTDPQTQSLLGTSCVFMDEHKLFKRFIDNSRKNINDYGIISRPTTDEEPSGKTANKVSVYTEYLGSRKENKGKYQRANNPYTTFSGTIIDDQHRIGSEFIINNKYDTDTSSEGFYIYMFREYSENLHPKPIYMKVEFNHAGIGKTIPFIIPMHWNEANENGDKTPDRFLTLRTDDLDELRNGVRLSDVYAQTYIPLYAVYDFQNKEYGYVFDDRYVRRGEDGNVTFINLNLFELKVMNETEEQTAQETAIIDINEGQFKSHDGGCGN